ncbi:replication protein A 70 kDa DNA-binding subunit B [Tanacetum coccineum]
MFRFEPLFEEGKCLSIANFAIAENSSRLPLLPHKYKISFYKGTTITRIDPIDDNVHEIILEPFKRLLDEACVYHEHEAVDVIGSVVAIGDVVPLQSSASRKIRRTVVIEDDELLRKVKYWNGAPAIHNVMFGTKMFINQDVPEMLSLVKELPEYDELQFRIEVFTPGKHVVTIAEFFHRAIKKMVSAIRECKQKSHCIVYAKIHKIHKESGWAYTACKQCNKKVDVVETKATTSSGKSKVTFYYEDDGDFKVIMHIIDRSAPIVFFNIVYNKISGYTAWELMEKHGMDVDEYWPQELDELVGKGSCLNCGTRITMMMMRGLQPLQIGSKSVALNELSITSVLDLHTPPSGMEASGSGQSSGGDKKRVFIDLNSIESEDEDESGSSKTPKQISVKIEKEY